MYFELKAPQQPLFPGPECAGSLANILQSLFDRVAKELDTLQFSNAERIPENLPRATTEFQGSFLGKGPSGMQGS